MVVGFHLGLAHLKLDIAGGWLGVDVFFVLSGYLITSLLLREHQRYGRVNLKNFYVRRLLRLAPLVVVLVALTVSLHLIGVAPRLSASPLGALSIVGYFSNWIFIRDIAALGVLSHCWSLSIEEQFYLVWPLLLVLATTVFPRSKRGALVLLTALGAIAVALYRRHVWLAALSWNRHNPFAYGLIGKHRAGAWVYWFAGSFTRTDGLFIGCLLAMLLSGSRPPSRMFRIGVGIVGFVALVAGSLLVDQAGAIPYPRFVPLWGLVLFNVCTAAVVAHLVLSPGAGLARALSFRPLTWVGRRAYGIYLLHPIVLALVLETGHLRGWAGLAITLAGTLLFAAASFRWIEQPFLRQVNFAAKS
jgi:peptidoglycan/LPS O-acetylase OafA/YrhL